MLTLPQRSVLLLAVLVLLTGCRVKSGTRIGWTGSSGTTYSRASYSTFDGNESNTFNVSAPGKIAVEYEARMNRGMLSMVVEGPDGSTVWSIELYKDAAKTSAEVTAPKEGTYKMVITGKDASGNFDVHWAAK